MKNKFAFRAKKCKKNGFYGVFKSALKRRGFLLYDSDDAQTYRLAFQLDAQVSTTIKTETLGKKLRFEPRKPQKIGFPGSTGLH